MDNQKKDTAVIGDFLKQVKRQVRLEENKKYKLLGVRWYGQGMFLREEKLGKEIKAEKLYKVHTGDFVYNRLFAWKSSFAIVEEDLDGCLVSNEFPTFEYDQQKIDTYFLLNYVLQPAYIDFVNRQSGGMSSVSRKRFKEEDFLQSTFPNYSNKRQKLIAVKIRNTRSKFSDLSLSIEEQLSKLSLLRQTILQEAIEGKLTAEWRKKNQKLISGENHASKLLEKIKAEKEQLIKEGKIRKDKPLTTIKPDEVPFALPDGWVWCRLPQILDFGDSLRRGPFGSSITKSMFIQKTKHATKVYEQKNAIYKDYSIGTYYIDVDEYPNLKSFMANPGDIIISCAGTIGETYLLPDDAPSGVINQALLKIRLNRKAVDNQFFINVFKSQTKSQINEDAKGTAMKNISSVDYLKNELLFPLPPLAEQQAIVEQVEKLMTMINELEKQVTDRKNKSERLMQSVLREAFEQ